MKLFTGCRLLLLALLGCFHLAAFAAPRTEHVFIVSIDGGKPAMMQQSPMPTLFKMAREGAATWQAQTIIPPSTLPAHTSMLTGVPMEQHGIAWNNWQPTNGVVDVPTVFAAAKQAGHSTALFAGKEKFRHLLQTNTVDEFYFDKSNAVMILKSDKGDQVFKKEGCIASLAVATNAANYITINKPDLCFIHFTDPDSVGHKFGWDSPEQMKAYGEVDAALGVVWAAIKKAGIARRSVVIVTADHGGHGKGHSVNLPEDMTIPWVVWGQGVKKHYAITNAVNTCDTAATALWLLDARPLKEITGKPVTSAFK